MCNQPTMQMHVFWLLALAAAKPEKKEAAWEKDWDQFEAKMKKQNDYFNKKLDALKTESPEMIKAEQGLKDAHWPSPSALLEHFRAGGTPSSFIENRLESQLEDIE